MWCQGLLFYLGNIKFNEHNANGNGSCILLKSYTNWLFLNQSAFYVRHSPYIYIWYYMWQYNQLTSTFYLSFTNINITYHTFLYSFYICLWDLWKFHQLTNAFSYKTKFHCIHINFMQLVILQMVTTN